MAYRALRKDDNFNNPDNLGIVKDPNRDITPSRLVFLMNVFYLKVEKILKGSLGSIPSPLLSVNIQIMGSKVYLRCKGKKLLGYCQQIFANKKFVDITQQCFALLPQGKFPANNLNSH